MKCLISEVGPFCDFFQQPVIKVSIFASLNGSIYWSVVCLPRIHAASSSILTICIFISGDFSLSRSKLSVHVFSGTQYGINVGSEVLLTKE